MTWEKTNIDITLDKVIKKIKQANISVSFKIKYLKHKEMPLFESMREDMKEDEMWSDLDRLDYGTLPPLRYKDDKDLIDEIIDAIKSQDWELNQTEIRFLQGNKSEYYSGTGNKIKMIFKYIGD